MFVERTLYSLRCDKCRRDYEDGDGSDTFWTKANAWDYAHNEGWKIIDGKHYCPDCCHWDEETGRYVVND